MLEYLLSQLANINEEAPHILLLRHAERYPVADGDDGGDVDITPHGVEVATQLGQQLKQRLQWANSSPLFRCHRTINVCQEAANVKLSIEDDHLLGNPGPFVVDRVKGGKFFAELGTEEIVRQFVGGRNFDGMKTAVEGTQLFSDHIKSLLKERQGLGLMISHDAIIIPMLAIWCQEDFSNKWLDPLDGVLITLDDKDNLKFYRNPDCKKSSLPDSNEKPELKCS